MGLTRAEKIELLKLQEEKDRRRRTRKILSFYPDEGPLRRELYVPHMKFFAAGVRHRERGMMSANRVGKTDGVGCFELACHLTGEYPLWWVGRRFAKPIMAWCAGTTAETTRDILQLKLMGPLSDVGSGMILGDRIVDFKRAASIPDAVETVDVKHAGGGISRLGFKAYKNGRKSFEGTEQDVILLDEEPPLDVYTECLIRTMTVNGLVLLTFTPMEGLSDVVMLYMPDGLTVDSDAGSGRFLIGATWDDAPHLSEKDKAELFAALPPHQRDARSKGIPSLGAGAIYPITEDDLIVDPFDIPAFWPRCYGFDPGWNSTAALWGARDVEHDILYLYSEYKRGQDEPVMHTHNVNLRGAWMNGVADYAGVNIADGEKVFELYKTLGLRIHQADKAVEAGIFDSWIRMTTGRLKVFRSMPEFLAEFRIYRRDIKGKVVKANDHLMDCMRYLVRSGREYEKQLPFNELVMKTNLFGKGMMAAGYNPLTFGLGAGGLA